MTGRCGLASNTNTEAALRYLRFLGDHPFSPKHELLFSHEFKANLFLMDGLISDLLQIRTQVRELGVGDEDYFVCLEGLKIVVYKIDASDKIVLKLAGVLDFTEQE
jgi:hypothetical protein